MKTDQKPGRTLVHIVMPDELLTKLDAEARERGLMSRSEVIRLAARQLTERTTPTSPAA